jgi:hypothetical protein
LIRRSVAPSQLSARVWVSDKGSGVFSNAYRSFDTHSSTVSYARQFGNWRKKMLEALEGFG